MKMVFIGACREVTGSCTYIEAAGKRFLVDFGMEQGKNMYENAKIPCAPSEIDFVLLTHAHVDHSGLLPLLSAGGFSGKIHSTKATANLCSIMLRDSAHIQEFEAEWRSRKNKRKGKTEHIPLYTIADAEEAIKCFVPHNYDEECEISEGVTVRFVDAGHLLGSSSIEVWLTENGETRKLVFSGDIGNFNQPLIRDPQYISEADYVVMESTYGDRRHTVPDDYETELASIINRTFARGGNLVVPSFAVGRTQEILYFIKKIKDRGLVEKKNFKVYIDSPLAIEATKVFSQNKESCFDEEALRYVQSGVDPIVFDGLTVAVTSDESKMINFDKEPKIIISASGMCEAGRIKHHLKHNLWREENTVMFAGYQAYNTLGRSLLDGAEKVKLFGEEVIVRAEIVRLNGISGHADLDGLIGWARAFGNTPKRIFVNHGENDAAEAFVNTLKTELSANAYAPCSGTSFDIATGEFIEETQPVPIERKTSDDENIGNNSVYARLLSALDRLTKLIKGAQGRANKDLARLTDRINDICDKFE